MSAMPAVVCEEVTKIYGTGHSAVAALRGVSFEMRKGEVCLIAGPSGCGKTTLLSILGGLLAPTSGRVKVLDQPLHALDDAALQRFRQQLVGFVFQAFNLVPSLTAVENVAVPLLLQGLGSEQALTRDAFIGQTLWWYALNSEDVGDMGSMLLLAVIVGFGLTGILLNLFTLEHLRFYALFKALGASNRVLTRMLLVQVLAIALFAGIVGIGVTAAVGAAVVMLDINYPFRLIWPAPLIALGGGLLIALLSSLWSLRPVWKLAPADILRQ